MAQNARIFVSHTQADASWCHTFVAALRQETQADIWYDEHNMGYGRLMDEIEREIRARPIFLVVLSPASVASKWVRREVAAAIELADHDAERIILPVVASMCEVPLFWREYRRMSGLGDTGLEAYDAAKRVARGLGLAPATSPQAPTPPRANETVVEAWERGKGLHSQGRYIEALAAFERALALDPKYTNAWNGKGIALFDLDRDAEALAAFERALALDPKNVAAWSNKGAVLRNLKRDEEALAACEQALALDPKYTNAWNGKGNSLRLLLRPLEALAAYERALALEPEFAFAWNGKGNALRELKHYEAALAAYERALALEPEFALAWKNRIDLLEQLGRKSEADTVRHQRDTALKATH